MLIPYLRLRYLTRRAWWHQSSWKGVWDLVKYVVGGRVVVACIQFRSNVPLQEMQLLLHGTAAHLMVAGVAGAGALFALLSVPFAHEFPLHPFWRFSGRRRWVARSFAYPVLSTAPLVVSMGATILIGWAGIGFSLLLYLAYRIASSSVPMRVMVIVVAAVVAVAPFSTTISWLIVTTVLAAGVAREFLWPPRGEIGYLGGSIAVTLRRILVAKEFACLRYYQSDLANGAITIAFVVLLIFTLVHDSTSAKALYRVTWLLPWLTALPFFRVLFNLLGTETEVLSHYVRSPEAAAWAMYERVRLYTTGLYVCDIALATIMGIMTASLEFGFSYLLGAALFTEALVLVAPLYSIAAVERKPVAYLYSYNLTSRNVYLTTPVVVLIAFGVHTVSAIGGSPALAVVYAVSLSVNTRWLRVWIAKFITARRFALLAAYA